MKPKCARLWEVEAARDGRLRGDALRSHKAHVMDCAVCGREARALESLAQMCRDGDAAAVDEVALRRFRDVILERADEQAKQSPRRRSAPTILFAAAALPIIAAVVVWIVWPTPAVEPPPVSAVLDVSVQPAEDAMWHRASTDEAETFYLEEGVLSLRVKRPPGGRRVFVRVPDGTIEDLGTVFHVEVRGKRTERVAVLEGQVHVVLEGGVDEIVRAGEVWRRPRLSAASPPPAETSAERSARPKPALRKPPSAPSASGTTLSLDGTAEDEAYLHVIELLREGRREEARAAARSYLERFPNGFRRDEMLQIASYAGE